MIDSGGGVEDRFFLAVCAAGHWVQAAGGNVHQTVRGEPFGLPAKHLSKLHIKTFRSHILFRVAIVLFTSL